MHHYYVSFHHDHGTSAVDIDLTHPITSGAEIAGILRILRHEGFTNPLVLAFSRFDTPPDNGEDTP